MRLVNIYALVNLLALLIFIVPAQAAYASDPFNILFGHEHEDLDAENRGERGNVVLVGLSIRGHFLDESWLALDAQNGLCLPLQAFTDAMNFPIQYSEGRATGWILNSNETLDIDISTQPGIHNTELGWCASLSVLEEIFPVQFRYVESTLTLDVIPDIILPLEAKLARIEARKLMENNFSSGVLDYPVVNNPYRWISWPSLDVSTSITSSKTNGVHGVANVDMSADLMKMSAYLRTVSRHDKFLDRTRLTVFRENGFAHELGLLSARRFALGDISVQALPLINRATAGRGISVSNRPLFKPELFDRTTIRGPLPQGWEAELYDNHLLLGFVTEPDENGEYVFDNVQLRPDYNRLTVKLFGPHGEEETRIINQFVGAELSPKHEFRYTFGYINPKLSLFGDRLDQQISGNEIDLGRTSSPYFFSSVDYGLSTKHSLRLDVRKDETDIFGTLSLIGSEFGGYGVLRLAGNGHGRPAIQGQFQRKLSTTSSLSLAATHYGDQSTQENGRGSGRITQIYSGRYDNLIRLGKHPISFRQDVSWTHWENGAKQLLSSNRMAGTFKHMRWNHILRYTESSGSSTRKDQRLGGELLLSRTFGGLRWRSEIGYSLLDSATLETITLGFQKKLQTNTHVQADMNYSFGENVTNFSSSLSHDFDPLAISLNAGYSSVGDWSIGLGVSFSLFNEKFNKGYRLAKPGLTRTGVIAPRVFDDVNANNIFDIGDQAMAQAEFVVDQTPRLESTNYDGRTILSDLPTAHPVNAILKLGSISDPFLRPVDPGRTFMLRPGQVLFYDVPLDIQGEAEGVVKFQKSGHTTPVSRVKIEAVNEHGKIVATTKSEYDGYFYFDNLPATTLNIRAAKTDVEKIGGTTSPITVKLSRNEPIALGITLFIKGIEENNF